MKKIQVVGLPGSGKTRGIELYRDKADHALSLLDFRLFQERYREAAFRRAIRSQDRDTIAESACGVYIPGTFVVRIEIPRWKLIENLNSRGDQLDEIYMNYLLDQTLPADYTVGSPDDLDATLAFIFKR